MENPGLEAGVQDGGQDTILEIERLLKMEKIPASPPPAPEPLARRRGYHLGKLFHSVKEKIDPQDKEYLADEAFIGYAKQVSTINATVSNAINIFIATVCYSIHDDSSHRLRDNPHMRHNFIIMALAFVPFAVLTAGVANSLKPRASYTVKINSVAVLLFCETVYMAVMSALFIYYIIGESKSTTVVIVTISVALVLIIVPWGVYKRPGFRWIAGLAGH